MNTYSEDQIKTLSNIMRFYADRYDIKKGSSNTSLRFSSTATTQTAFFKMVKRDHNALRKHCGRSEYNALMDSLADQLSLEDDEDILKELSGILFGRMISIVHKEAIQKAVGSETVGNNIVKTFSYENIIPIIDITSSQKVMFNVKSGNVVHGVAYETYCEWLTKQSKELKDAHNTFFSPAKIEFDPQTGGNYKYVTLDDGQEIISVNSHNMPEWRKEELANPVMPQEFTELMEHLFPRPECRKYILNWIYHTLDSRSAVHLLMHGHRGIGKNTIIYIMENLVGKSNYYYVPKDFWDNNFNSELRHKRLLYFDEHKLDAKQNESEFKQYHEPKMAYHGKGMPIIGLEKNHASHVISNNTQVTNHIVYETRRFSVPVLTHTPISEALGRDWLDEIHRLKEDKDFLANVGWWILKNANTDYTPEDPYKSPLFYDLVHKALFPWQKFIIDLIKGREGEKYDLEDFTEELGYKGKKIGRVHIENFLATHKDENEDSYGYLIQGTGGKRSIIPSEKYMPKDVQETEQQQVEF